MSHLNHVLQDILKLSPVIPVMVIEEPEQAVPMARALVAGGLGVLEITLRSDCALEAIRQISRQVPDAIVGAGTVNDAGQFRQAHEAGAQFAISPGQNDGLLQAADEIAMPWLPGVATPGEAMRLAERGYRYLKLFPAEVVGGRAMLKALLGPLPDLKFCPTGGVTAESAPDYLALANVICVGGSWILPKEAVKDNRWPEITRLSQQAAALR